MNILTSMLLCKKPLIKLSDATSEYIDSLSNKALSQHTMYEKKRIINNINKYFGAVRINKMTAKEISNFINSYIDDDKECEARNTYFTLKAVFQFAKLNDYLYQNPFEVIPSPKPRVKRARLNIDEFWAIYKYASRKKIRQKYQCLHEAFLLALVSAQRKEDLINLRFSDIKDNHLYVDQEKGNRFKKIKGKIIKVREGSLIALPLKLKIKTSKGNFTLKKAIKQCSGETYLFEHKGKPLESYLLSVQFGKIRDILFPRDRWGDFSPPTFHEIRALAERIYREQEVDTKTLLGHKNQSTTDIYYNCGRGRLRTFLKVK